MFKNNPVKNMLIFHPPVFCSLLTNFRIGLCVFLEPNYTYKCKIIYYNNSANRFDNFKILMYNQGGIMSEMTIIPDLYLEGDSKQ